VAEIFTKFTSELWNTENSSEKTTFRFCCESQRRSIAFRLRQAEQISLESSQVENAQASRGSLCRVDPNHRHGIFCEVRSILTQKFRRLEL
jgi:hypothetical protein